METNNTNREEHREHREMTSHEANELRAQGRRRHENGTRKVNKLWLWLGVLFLIFILIWWLWTIGTFEDLTGVTNG